MLTHRPKTSFSLLQIFSMANLLLTLPFWPTSLLYRELSPTRSAFAISRALQMNSTPVIQADLGKSRCYLTHLNTSLTTHDRQTYWALMVRNSATLMADITAIYMDEVTNIKNATGVVPAIIYQPITEAMTSHFTKNGGNALGFTDKDGPLNRRFSFRHFFQN
jgi:hypothetical protein